MSKQREKKDKILFDKISIKYASKDIYPVSKKARAFQVECLKDFISKEYQISHVENLIEVGCGHGANSHYMKEVYTNYLGVDYSNELINVARERYGNTKTKFEVENIKNIEKYGNFDLVVGIGILHHVDDIEEALNKMKEIGHKNTVYIFYEPQRGNPVIQILRAIRTKVDPAYSADQVFFKKQELTDIIDGLGFRNTKSRYNGYFTPPFAQVPFKPSFIFLPLCKLFIHIDRFLFKKISSKFAWNFMIAFTR